MKRLLFIISLLIMVLAPASCFYMDDAETVDPGDEAFTNPTPPVGGVTTLTATIIGPTIANPVIKISFSTPIHPSSISYGTNILIGIAEAPPDIFVWPSEGSGAGEYDGIPDFPATEPTSVITLDLRNYILMFSAGYRIRLVLSPDIAAYANTSVLLSNHGTFDYTL